MGLKSIFIRCFIVFALFLTNVNAISLRDTIEKTINTNPAIVAEHKNQDAFRKYIDQEEGDYLPTLDLETYYEESHTYNEPNDAVKNDAHKNGWNAQLELEQILYDGGLTPSEIQEYQHKYDANRFRSNLAIEDIIFESTKTYLNLVQYHELKHLSQNMIELHEKNLITALEKEDISGEKLETYQVSAKLHLAKERLYEQEDLSLKAKYDFKRYVGVLPDEEICRPLVDDTVIPNTLEKTVKFAIRKNFSILEQIENIKVQREKLTQADAKFLPTLLFQLQAEWDNDLLLAENGRQDEYRAKLFMSWNLLEGGKDRIASQRELIFLQESKKVLDSVTAEVVSSVTNAYHSYQQQKKRVEMLKLYAKDNRNILDVYIEEFDSGTRTFIDILNAEAELYNSKTSLTGREFELLVSYYNMLSSLSIMSDTILSAENQSCENIVIEKLFDERSRTENKNDSADDLELEGLFESEPSPKMNKDKLKKAVKKKKEKIKINPKNKTLEEESSDEVFEKEPSDDMFDDLMLDDEPEEKVETNVSPKNKTADAVEELTYEDEPEKKVEKNLLEESKPVDKEIIKDDVVEKEITNNDMQVFLDSPPMCYTLNITTETGLQEAKYVLSKYGLRDKGYTFAFGKDSSQAKVLYGVYTTYKKAEQALFALDTNLVNKLAPYIDSVKKHQNLYRKYN